MAVVGGKGSKALLIGLVGSPGSRKKAVSNFLYYSYGFVKIDFADKVREVGSLLGRTDRRSLQTIRHALRRRLGEDLWIGLLEKRMEEELFSRLVESYSIPGVSEVKGVLRVVIGDIGYRNELEFVRERKGLLIGLRAREETLYKRLREGGEVSSRKEFRNWLRHPSEKETPSLIEECDFIIDTDNVPLRRVEEMVDKIVRRHFVEELR